MSKNKPPTSIYPEKKQTPLINPTYNKKTEDFSFTTNQKSGPVPTGKYDFNSNSGNISSSSTSSGNSNFNFDFSKPK